MQLQLGVVSGAAAMQSVGRKLPALKQGGEAKRDMMVRKVMGERERDGDGYR